MWATISINRCFENMCFKTLILLVAFLCSFAIPVPAEEALEEDLTLATIDVDVIGNDIIVSTLKDPQVEGVACHFTYFERGAISRIGGLFSEGSDPFEDPSNTAIACRQVGPIKIGAISDGEEIFTHKAALLFKDISVKRFYDCKNNTLVYVSHSREVFEGSAKASISTVPLYAANATWVTPYVCDKNKKAGN
jgi:CreA protein